VLVLFHQPCMAEIGSTAPVGRVPPKLQSAGDGHRSAQSLIGDPLIFAAAACSVRTRVCQEVPFT